MKLHLTVIVIFVVFTCSPAQQIAKGKVFIDKNENNELDSFEAGLPGVPISNGRDIVLSNENGIYEIPVRENEIIFMIKPSGYEYSLNDTKLPQFYYIHKPKGSPDLKFKGSKPTGALPDQINFSLKKSSKKDSFDILVFADPQPYDDKELSYFDKDIIQQLENVEGFEFGISLGDLVGNDLNLFKSYAASVNKIGIPWMNVYGNHDMNFDAQKDEFADETFEATFGPATYSFNHGKVHFIIIDNVIYPKNDSLPGYIGGFTDKQLEFIENDLKHVTKDNLLVLAMHIPLSAPSWRKNETYFRSEDRKKLFHLIKDYPFTFSLSGHTHVQQIKYFDRSNGWKGENYHLHYNVGTASGDWWTGKPDSEGIPDALMRDGTPNGYAVIKFRNNQFEYDYVAARQKKSVHMSIWGPKVVPYKERDKSEIFVNFFLGCDSTQVKYRVNNDGSWFMMQKANIGDPYVTSSRNSWDLSDTLKSGRRPSNAVLSSHLWKSKIPNNLEPSDHTITIKVIDTFGREYYEEFIYKIVKR